MADNPRLDDLRRRVQADPGSIAFAQLAEECRRAGDAEGAVDVCRTGLARHPGYVSARVTLGRALIELNRLDEATTELSLVLEQAPDNLAALRGLSVVHRRRGELEQALAWSKSALELAPRDPDLERTTEELTRQIEARRAEAARTPPPLPVPLAVGFAATGEGLNDETVSTPAVASTDGSLTPGLDDRASRMLAALEQWLAAVHVARARRRA